MRNGFYEVKLAERWGGYVHRGSGGVVQSGSYPISTLNGKIGFFDERLFALRNPAKKNPECMSTIYTGEFYSGTFGSQLGEEPKKPYLFPLIFRPEVLMLREKDDWFVAAFFKEDELRELTLEQARRRLHPLVMRRYGDLEVIPVKPEVTSKPGELTSPFEEMEVPCLVNIPLYLPYTQKKTVERRIKQDVKAAREANKRIFGK